MVQICAQIREYTVADWHQSDGVKFETYKYEKLEESDLFVKKSVFLTQANSSLMPCVL